VIIGHLEDYVPGQGTYVRKNYIYASVVGYKDIQIQSPKQVLNVIKEREPTIVPEMHSVVIGRVMIESSRKFLTYSDN
jgi:exosome complex RNA-binding protein Rrp4